MRYLCKPCTWLISHPKHCTMMATHTLISRKLCSTCHLQAPHLASMCGVPSMRGMAPLRGRRLRRGRLLRLRHGVRLARARSGVRRRRLRGGAGTRGLTLQTRRC